MASLPNMSDFVNKVLPDEDFDLGAQPLSFQDESSSSGPDDRYMLSDAERDTRDRALQRRDAMRGLPQPRKQPREKTPEPPTLSLHEYFEITAVPLNQRASICRAYASYVKSEAPPAPRKKQKK
jgi:hypothetical protein